MNVKYAFKVARKEIGNPTAIVISPIDEWTIPAGYTVDYSLDEVRDAGGNIVDPSTIWEFETVDILPEARNETTLSMTLAGVRDVGNVAFIIMPDDIDTLKDAFRVIIDSVEYNVSSVSIEPPNRNLFALVSCTLWK